jgi:hypothetical protein
MRPSAMSASAALGATRYDKLARDSACAWLRRSYRMWSKSFDGRRNVERLLSRLNMVVPTNMSSSSQRTGDVIRRCRGDRGRCRRPRYIELRCGYPDDPDVKPLAQTVFIVCLGESFLRHDKLMSIAASPMMMVPPMIKNALGRLAL